MNRALVVAMAIAAAGMTGRAQSVERQLIVSAVDRDGQPVTGLTASDFLVREDGEPREVLQVAPAPDGRQIALLVDTSEGAGPVIADIRRGASAFVEAMSGGRDEMAIIAFGGVPRILAETTTRAASLREGVGRIFAFPQSASYLLDAVGETVEGFEQRQATRPVIVVMTALGIDHSHLYAESIVDRLLAAGTAFYAVVFAQDAAPAFGGGATFESRTMEERRRLLSLGVERTGGRRRELLASSAAERAMRLLAADLRNQYLLVYARPETLIPPDRIEVESTREDVDARGIPVPGDE